jgi:prevent-host-death family protein
LRREEFVGRYSVVEAKNNLPKLINKAIAGEEVVITRHGEPVVEVRSTARRDRSMASAAYERLRRGRDALPRMPMTSVELFDALYQDGPQSDEDGD